jgi:hypothetical protein
MNKIAILINSCYKYHNTTINQIIDSAKKAKIPSDNIYIVVGESDNETDIMKYNDYNIVFCKFVNIDYNAIIYFTQTKIGLNELSKYTHFFYIHDTALFLDCFWEKINKYSINCDTYIKLEEIGTKNIGLFNTQWFISNKSELFSYYINYDKSLQLKYKDGDFPNKDFIYSKFNNLANWLNEDCMFLFDNGKPIGNVFINNDKHVYYTKKYSDQERRATVYNEPGVEKFQINYIGNGIWNLEL